MTELGPVTRAQIAEQKVARLSEALELYGDMLQHNPVIQMIENERAEYARRPFSPENAAVLEVLNRLLAAAP